MRTLLLSLMLFSGVRLLGADAPAAPELAVRCISRGEAAEKGANPPISIFSDQPLKFDAEVTAPLGSRLGIYGDLFQASAGGWSMPLLKNVRLSADLQFDARTQWIVPCTVPSVPTVRAPTRMVLKLYVRTQAEPDAQRPMGVVDLFIYPRRPPAEWSKMFAAMPAQGGVDGVAVFGGRDRLRGFFRRQGIAFHDLGAEWPETLDSHTLYLGDAPPPGPSHPLNGVRMALFLASGSAARLPGVYSIANPAGGAIVKVTLPAVLDHLDDDPRSQEVFLETVRQALDPQAPLDYPASTLP